MTSVKITRFNMAIAEIITQAVINLLVKKAEIHFSEEKNDSLSNRLEAHLHEVVNWAENFDFVGLGTPKLTRGDSVCLTLSTAPRRYRPVSRSVESKGVDESRFLTTKSSLVLLGDPGSGKTTTLKRTALELLHSSPNSDEDVFRFPLLVILKEIQGGISPVCEEIARKFGIAFNIVEDPPKEDGEPGKRRVLIGNLQIIDAMADLLNSINAVLLLDGLDELDHKTRDLVENEIGVLGRKLNKSKIIVSCRSGDHRRNFSGFNVYEIMPLDLEQVASISKVWLDNPEDFLNELSKCPYQDMVDRPLLLTFLLFLFDAEGCLPEQPSLIYRKVVFRLLRDWDKERSIRRKSKYSKFDEDRKIDFLSEFSYILTCRITGKIFSELELIKAYKIVCESFSLPENEHMEVVSELETHTGIIIQAGFNRFQFSHLSLQEYFCAHYLSRAPFLDLMSEYLNVYPAPLAVACAISADPGRFFTTLVEHPATGRFISSANQNSQNMMLSFLTRLRLENPIFRSSTSFGISVLYVFAVFYSSRKSAIDIELEKLLNIRNVTESVIEALRLTSKSISPTVNKTYVLLQLEPQLMMTKAFTSRLPVRLPIHWWKKFKVRITK